GVLEVRHEHLRARVQRVDDHLSIDGTGDFDPAVLEVGGNAADGPIAGSDMSGVWREIGSFASVVALLHRATAREQFVDARTEATRQVFDECHRRRREHAPGVLNLYYSHKRVHYRELEGLRKPDCRRVWYSVSRCDLQPFE